MTMLEKCARAVCPYKKRPCPGGACFGCESAAKVVIQTLLEPSEGMLSAAGKSEGARRVNGLLQIATAHGARLNPDDPPPLKSMWQAMLNHVLEGK